MAGCSCTIIPDGGASRRNEEIRDLPDAVLFARMERAQARFERLGRRPLVAFAASLVGLADRDGVHVSGLEYARLCALAGEAAPGNLDAGRMVRVPIERFRDLLAGAASRRAEWEGPGEAAAA